MQKFWIKVLKGTAATGIAIFVISLIVSFLVNLVLPYDLFALEGVRAMDDPIMLLFFLHPFLLGFGLSLAYQIFRPALEGNCEDRANLFFAVLLLLIAIPGTWVVATSMNYPFAFLIDSFLGQVVYLFISSRILSNLD